jgi:hypothetical protein
MKKLADALAVLMATLWAGGLWGVGYIAVPVLFYAQPDRVLAGLLAGRMFSALAFVGEICAVYLLAYLFGTLGKSALKQTVFRIVAAMLVLTLVTQLGIQPVMNGLKAQAAQLDVMQSQWAGQFKMLHGISSIIYLLQSLLGALLALKIRR